MLPRHRPAIRVVLALAVATATAGALRAAEDGAGLVTALLTRLTDRVEGYYTKARSVVCVETVRLQPLGFDLMPEGRARVLEYELRVSWDPADDPAHPPEPTINRTLRRVDGRVPKPGEEPGCTDPPAVATDPLAMLLPGQREKYVFSFAGTGHENHRAAVMLNYKSRSAEPADVKWHGDCVSISLPGRTRGRLWIDAESEQVLRLDEQLTGPYDLRIPPEKVHFGPLWMEVERDDTTTRYRAVVFHDPDETLMLPERVDSVQIVRNSGTPRLRLMETYSDYKRFVTDARIVKDPDVR